jgi:ribosomal protein L11 methyltransferase
MTKNNDEYHQIEFNIAKDDLAETEKILESYQPLSISMQGFGEEKIYEPLPGEMPIWEKIRVKAMYQNIKNLSDLENEIINKTNIKILNNKVIRAIGEKDWQEEWVQSSKPMRFGKKLWIYPDHLIDNLEGKVCVNLNPGLAFGTGSHPTTRLCLEWLEKSNLDQKSVLDYGCGSGILGISAIKLGAKSVTAIDLDPQAVIASKNNAEKNHVQQEIEITDNNKTIEKNFNIIVANILAKPLIELAPYFYKKLNKEGAICLSGILEGQINIIKDAYLKYFNLSEIKIKDGWVMMSGIKL